MLSYLVSCRVGRGASRPGLATDKGEYCFLGSWEELGFQGLESAGSYQASGAVKNRKRAIIKVYYCTFTTSKLALLLLQVYYTK